MPKYLEHCAFAVALAVVMAPASRAEEPAPITMFGVAPSRAATATGGVIAARDPAWTAVVTASLGLRTKPNINAQPHAFDGIASFYSQGARTASGEAFDKRAMTAAHPTLPMGTKVRVTNLGNGRMAVVRINDRGPFVPGRIIDVSEAAAEALGMQGRGLAPVRVDVVSN